MRSCNGCGKPLRRWQRGCFHGIYTAVTPYEWERRMGERWQASRPRRAWKRLAYGSNQEGR